MVWIVLAIVLVSLLYLALVLRTLPPRLAALREVQLKLAATAQVAGELSATVAGLAAHADSLKVRVELAQEQLSTIKGGGEG